MKLTPKEKAKLLELIESHRADYRGDVDSLHLRMFQTDLAYHRATKQYIEECGKADTVPENVTPPVVLEQTETAVSYLSSLFLARSPIYSPQLSPGNEEKEQLIERLMQSYQDDNMWIAEELQALRNTVKHNIAASVITWKPRSLRDETNRVYSGRTTGLTNNTLSLYDCLWDTSIHPKYFQSEGMYFEHISYKRRHHVNKLLQDIPSDDRLDATLLTIKDLKNKRYKHIDPLGTLHHALHGTGRATTSGGETDYTNFFNSEEPATSIPSRDAKGHKVSTIWLRATAEELGKKLAKGDLDRYSIYRAILIDDTVVSFVELDLPMFEVVLSVGIVDDFGYDTKSLIEPTNAYQDVATTLIKSKMASARRAVHDKGIFNPLFVSSTDINGKADALKIPIRRSQWFTPNATSQAYSPMAFNDSTTRDSLNDANLFMSILPNRATGISEFRRGPVKGNRSKGQFALESQGADGRGYLLALTLEASRYSSIRKLMKITLIANAPDDATIGWSTLANEGMDFRINDGLTSLGMFDDLSNLETFTNLAAQNPKFTPVVEGILRHVISARTPFKLTDFTEESPNEQPPTNGQGKAGDPADPSLPIDAEVPIGGA